MVLEVQFKHIRIEVAVLLPVGDSGGLIVDGSKEQNGPSLVILAYVLKNFPGMVVVK